MSSIMAADIQAAVLILYLLQRSVIRQAVASFADSYYDRRLCLPSFAFFGFLFGNRIVAMSAEWITAQDAPYGKPASTDNAETFDRFDRICRTGRRKTAGRRCMGRYGPLIKADQRNQYPLHRGSTPKVLSCASIIRFTCVLLHSSVRWRATNTISHPPSIRGSSSR